MMSTRRRKKTPIKTPTNLVIVLVLVAIAIWGWQKYKAHQDESRQSANTEVTERHFPAPTPLPPAEQKKEAPGKTEPKAQQGDANASDTGKKTKKPDYEKVIVPPEYKSNVVKYPGFTVSFNPEYKQPNYVVWELTRDEASSNTVSRTDNFMPDPKVEGCPTLADYQGSGFDRGHMAPAADMKWSLDAMNSCFLLTNMSPQHHALNSGAWNTLEDKCREWAKRDSAIIIVCGPVLADEMPRTIGASKIPVPERYFKVILAPYADEPRAIGFIMPNGKVNGGMAATAVSVDEVEAITGFDFFSALPNKVENKIEAECNYAKWTKR